MKTAWVVKGPCCTKLPAWWLIDRFLPDGLQALDAWDKTTNNCFFGNSLAQRSFKLEYGWLITPSLSVDVIIYPYRKNSGGLAYHCKQKKPHVASAPGTKQPVWHWIPRQPLSGTIFSNFYQPEEQQIKITLITWDLSVDINDSYKVCVHKMSCV